MKKRILVLGLAAAMLIPTIVFASTSDISPEVDPEDKIIMELERENKTELLGEQVDQYQNKISTYQVQGTSGILFMGKELNAFTAIQMQSLHSRSYRAINYSLYKKAGTEWVLCTSLVNIPFIPYCQASETGVYKLTWQTAEPIVGAIQISVNE